MYKLKKAFTLAETLITIGIIGIVAAITIPPLVSKHREQVAVNKLRKTYALLKNAESMAINDYGDINGWDFIDLTTPSTGAHPSLNTRVFDKYYAPYLKTGKCKYTATIKAANGTSMMSIYAGMHYVCLPDGIVLYGNTQNSGYTGTLVYVDLNGEKKPNIVGKDVFTLFINRPVYKSDDYNTSSYRVVPKCPVGISTCFAGPYQGAAGNYWKGDEETMIKHCTGGSDSIYTIAQLGNSCAYMIEQAGWKIPKNYPIKF